jgi:hypothetical protein
VQHDCIAELIRRDIRGLAGQLLGRHVRDRAEQRAGQRERRRVEIAVEREA